MQRVTFKQGITTPVIIAIVAGLVVLGSVLFYNIQPKEEIMMEEGKDMMEEGEAMMEEGKDMMEEGEAMMEEGEAVMEENKEETVMEKSAQ